MGYTTEELTKRVKESIASLTTEYVKKYNEGKNRAAWTLIDYNSKAGKILLVQYPNDCSINVTWSPIEAGFADLGCVVGAVSTEYFGIEKMVTLLVDIIQAFMDT